MRMPAPIEETEFLDCLARAVERTKDFIARLTDYQGGEVRTEYLITADVAREFVERGFEVKVECLNRNLVNALTRLPGSTPKKSLGAKRTDVAVLSSGLVPLAIIEVKIGVKALGRVKADLKKIADTIRMMKRTVSKDVIGAMVFQIHVSPSRSRYHAADFLKAAKRIECGVEKELALYAAIHKDFAFAMHPLQPSDEGAVGREIEVVGDEKAWGADGHATRYHAILLRQVLLDR